MENNLDKLFKSKLEGQEPEFNPAAWERMEELLDDEGMIPSQKKKPNRSKIIYLSLLFFGILFSVLGFVMNKSISNSGKGSANVASENPISNSYPATDSIVEASTITHSNTPALFNTASEEKSIAISTFTESQNRSSISNENTNAIATLKQNDGLQLYSDQKGLDALGNEFIYPTEIVNGKATPAINQPKIIERSVSRLKNGVSDSKTSDIVLNSEMVDGIAAGNNISIEESLENSREDDDSTLEKNSDNESKTQISKSDEVVGNMNVEIDETRRKETLPIIDVLKTRTEILVSNDRIIAPQFHKMKSGVFEIGLQTVVRFNGGLGYSIGPYVSYNLGDGYAINFGGQYDSQNFEAGPEISVFDKVYSFGSTLNERKFSLNNQKSLRLPLTMRKSFQRFSLSIGLILNKVFMSEGVMTAEEVITAQSEIIDSEMIKPMTISFQLGTSVRLNRYFDIDLGIEFKPKAFVTDPLTSNNYSKYYPTMGLRYTLFKN